MRSSNQTQGKIVLFDPFVEICCFIHKEKAQTLHFPDLVRIIVLKYNWFAYLSTIEVGLRVKIDFRFDNPLLIFGGKHEKPTKMPYISWSENGRRR